MFRTLSLFVAAALCLLLCSSAPGAGEIRVSGGGAAISWAYAPVVPSFTQETGVRVTLAITSPAQGLIDLERGLADVATAAMTIEDVLEAAKAAGVPVDQGSLTIHELGQTRRLVFLHKSNPVRSLTNEQVASLFTGRIENWKALGGNDEPVVVVWGAQTPGQNHLFTSLVFGNQPVTAKAVKATDYRDIVRKVMRTPGAVGIDPEGYVNGAVRTLEAPAIPTPIIAITKGKPSSDVQKLLDYLREMNRDF